MNKIILKNKPNLIGWLSSDSIHILQHVQANEIITTPQYNELMPMTVSRDRVIKLLDYIIQNGPNACREFLNVLKSDDVNEISPDLRTWIRTVDTSGSETASVTGQSRIQVTQTISGSGNVFAPTMTGSNTGSIEMNMNVPLSGSSYRSANYQKPEGDWERRAIQDYQNFLRNNTSSLVQKVKNIAPILDDLDLHDESKANVRAETTNQEMMRRLLYCVNCESIAKNLVDALFKHEESLMKELKY